MPDIGYIAKCIGSILRAYGWATKLTPPAQEDELEEKKMKLLQEVGHVAHNPEHDARVQGKFFFFLKNELDQLA